MTQPLATGQGITRWEITAPDETYFPGKMRPHPDEVDYEFRTGWIETGDLPCREALLEQLENRQIAAPAGPFDQLYIADDSARIDFSQFCKRPMLITRGLRCTVIAQKAGLARFRLATCGGVRIWRDGAPVASFEPFTRNQTKRCDVTFELPEGPSEILVRLEDLHERDTTCFFSLTYLDGVPVVVDSGEDAALNEAAAVLEGLRTDAVFYENSPIRFVSDHASSQDVALELTSYRAFLRGGGNEHMLPAQTGVPFTLGPTAPVAEMPAEVTQHPGCLHLFVTAKVGAATLTRQLGTTVLTGRVRISSSVLEARKSRAASLIARTPEFGPCTAAVLLERGEKLGYCEKIIDACLIAIEERHDCSDFLILPLLRIWRDHRNALPEALQDRLKAAIVEYRYWMDEPGNDVMWFWSENHVLCFHVAQLVAGMLLPETQFTGSGRSGLQQADRARVRLHRWFDAIDRDGLGEWNSAAYYPIDMLALFSLRDLGADKALAARATALLDMIFVMTGLHTTGGVPAGSQGRAYEKEILAGPVTELGTVAAIAFGGDWYPNHDRAAALFCLSDYVPPDAAQRFAQMPAGSTLRARYAQGLEQVGKLALWKSSQVQLSSVVDHKTGTAGHQQHVIDAQFAGHPLARFWINTPGELKVWGERRPSLLAGNSWVPRVVQNGPQAVVLYDIPDEPGLYPFSQLLADPNAFDGVRQNGNWLFLRSGDGVAGIWSSSTALAMEEGLYKGALWRVSGRQSAWYIQVGDLGTGQDFDSFCAGLSAAHLQFDPATLALTATGLPDGHVAVDYETGTWVQNDAPMVNPTLSMTPTVALNTGPLRPWNDLTWT